jgi:hypothetical protein
VDKGDMKDRSSRKKFLRFLCTLALKLRENPSIFYVFFDESVMHTKGADVRGRCALFASHMC